MDDEREYAHQTFILDKVLIEKTKALAMYNNQRIKGVVEIALDNYFRKVGKRNVSAALRLYRRRRNQE